MTITYRALLATILLASGTTVVAQSLGGVQLLTTETAQAAVARATGPEPEIVLASGRHVTPTVPSPVNSPALIRVNGLKQDTAEHIYAAKNVLEALADSPFHFRIVTPYVVMVDITREAIRKYLTPQYPSLETLNAALVNVEVTGSSFLKGDLIENVVIKRGDQVLKPLTARVTPLVVTNAMGATKDGALGVFTFDYATFAPDMAITLVLIGRAGNFEWTMSPEELGQLK